MPRIVVLYLLVAASCGSADSPAASSDGSTAVDQARADAATASDLAGGADLTGPADCKAPPPDGALRIVWADSTCTRFTYLSSAFRKGAFLVASVEKGRVDLVMKPDHSAVQSVYLHFVDPAHPGAWSVATMSGTELLTAGLTVSGSDPRTIAFQGVQVRNQANGIGLVATLDGTLHLPDPAGHNQYAVDISRCMKDPSGGTGRYANCTASVINDFTAMGTVRDSKPAQQCTVSKAGMTLSVAVAGGATFTGLLDGSLKASASENYGNFLSELLGFGVGGSVLKNGQAVSNVSLLIEYDTLTHGSFSDNTGKSGWCVVNASTNQPWDDPYP